MLGPKGSGEIRIAALGGSTTFGYRVPESGSFPVLLEGLLNEQGPHRFSVANLGFNNDSAACFEPTAVAYDFLEPDLYVVYSGLNDSPRFTLARTVRDCGRWSSPLFRCCGLLPLTPTAWRERYLAFQYGSVEAGYRALRPQSAERLDAVRDADEAVWTASIAQHKGGAAEAAALSEIERGTNLYVDHLLQFAEWSVKRGRPVLFACQPLFGETSSIRAHREDVLRSALEKRFPSDSRVRYHRLATLFEAGERSNFTLDGSHLTPAGNARLAGALTGPIQALVQEVGDPRQ